MGFRWRAVPLIWTMLIAAVAIVAILVLNDGRLTYTLDDAYIHLALSENVASGHYGIEPGEYSAPSSSILWPILLAAGAGLPGHGLLPLLIGLIATLATIELLTRVCERADLVGRHGQRVFVAVLLSVLVVVLNLVGVVLTGMEHSLQVALALTVVLGMIDVHRGAPVPWYLYMAIVVGPLVRYENAAVSVAAIVMLLACRRWRAAVAAAVCVTAVLVGFSVFLLNVGLGPLPAPVHEGSSLGDGFGWFPEVKLVIERLKEVLWKRSAAILAIFAGGLVAVALGARRDARLLFAGAVVPVLHLGFGKVGGFGRYEIYALACVLALLLYGLRDWLRTQIEGRGPLLSLAMAGVVLVPALADPAVVVFRSPRASHNIFQQQHQMHRFVTEFYGKPVAVNDLGRVSYRNSEYVLDLWGLASDDVLRARLTGSSEWPARFVEQRQIGLVMIYESWFKSSIPIEWQPIARLELLGKRITPASSTVSIYVTRQANIGEILAALESFRPTLPPDAELTIIRGSRGPAAPDSAVPVAR